ncbi:DEAD/DEAH box helicase [Primorskyibacter flagellatus]|uniref:ATP-dependent RNA helicase DeaD n=1 Tax=Primorskyibacter flagellatus TaxID=1387277 RepID=A0A1W2BXH4_9RHOB|nr:DEAD/DEAH box helicase [Primorskyibacter flagellatus]SMC77705.1 ATP-dependent RNA helicase DeaD [Primorskyibacter flagellatus]
MIPPLSEALAERGYDKLTPVQEAVTDPDLTGSDLLVSAQTGSGKTVGFGLAIAPTILEEAERFGPAAAPLALVVAPTRELAFQVMRELSWLFAKTGGRVTSCVGGMDMRDERRALDRGAHIVVGTPGRLRDHIQRGSLDMTGLRAIVLDEADEMLDLGFREDLEFMLGEAPEDRRTLMFSATVPPMIATLAKQFQRDARRISTLGGAKQHTDIEYQAVRVAQSDSEHAIFNMLRFHDTESAIVFANTRAAVSHLTARLANRGFAVVSLSGELSQTERTHALQAMRDGRARICVATDVAARGIDLPNLNLVIHADLPTNTESLLHRSGRTGRAGRKGISALIVPAKAAKKAERLLKWAKINAEWVTAPSADDILKRDEERLLNDPAWGEPVTEEQGAFAAKLLALHTPEAIAAAYLRLYRDKRSAPEELLPPDTKAPAREHKAFGPSQWFALSVGNKDRAEARWLLPLLCRAGNIDKSAIGAIRVQDSETFVELTKASTAGFVSALGPDGLLEEGITARQLDRAPDIAPQRGGPNRGARPAPKGAHGGNRSDAARGERKPRTNAAPRPASAGAAPANAEASVSPKPTAAPRPATDSAAPDASPRPDYTAAHGPAKAKHTPARGGKPDARGGKPGGGKPSTGKSFGGKPSGGKPSGGKPSGGKPFGGKPGGGKPGGKPVRAASDARDSSKRFTPPGKATAGPRKSGPGSQSRKGGTEPPRRTKR